MSQLVLEMTLMLYFFPEVFLSHGVYYDYDWSCNSYKDGNIITEILEKAKKYLQCIMWITV